MRKTTSRAGCVTAQAPSERGSRCPLLTDKYRQERLAWCRFRETFNLRKCQKYALVRQETISSVHLWWSLSGLEATKQSLVAAYDPCNITLWWWFSNGVGLHFLFANLTWDTQYLVLPTRSTGYMQSSLICKTAPASQPNKHWCLQILITANIMNGA